MVIWVYIVLCLIWGSTWGAIKIGLGESPPIWAAGERMLLAGGMLLVFNWLTGRRYPSGWFRKWQVAWPGLCTYALSYMLGYIGTVYVSSGLASILFATFPFFVILLVALMVKSEKITARDIIGVILGFVGTVIIFAGPLNLDAKALWGAVLLVLGALAAAYGTVHVKAFLSDEPILPMITLQIIFGGIVLAVAAVIFEGLGRLQMTAMGAATVVYLAVFGTIIAFGGYFWLLQRITTVTISLIALITPLLAVLLGWLALGEKLGIQDIFGAALVLGGVFIVTARRKA